MALGSDPLRAQVFKVPHHASKHGVNLELVELIKPRLTLVSSAAGGGRYNFPHTVAQESVREALEAIASTGAPAPARPRARHPLHGASDSDGRPLGSVAVVVSPTGRKRRLWRFGDRPSEPIDLGAARLYAAAEETLVFEQPETVPA